MEDSEAQTQKSVVSFCKFLPGHVDKWKSVMQRSVAPIRNLSNFSEQLLCVEQANLDHITVDFGDSQKALQGEIMQSSEEDMLELKTLLDELHKTNQDLRNKLFSLERLSQDLPWEEDYSVVIKGTGSQPPLKRILQDGLKFSTFFSKTCRQISEKLKDLDLRNRKSLTALELALSPDLNDTVVCNLLAITQYVGNEKAIS